jgi:hypothetical protein
MKANPNEIFERLESVRREALRSIIDELRERAELERSIPVSMEEVKTLAAVALARVHRCRY